MSSIFNSNEKESSDVYFTDNNIRCPYIALLVLLVP
jgi:hypothetical protein